MSYEMLLKETESLSYEEQVNLMAYLATSIQAEIQRSRKDSVQQQLDALNTLAGLFTQEEMIPVDESISTGIKIREVET